MTMKCGCIPSYYQIDLEGREVSYCQLHDTYEIEDKESPNIYNDFQILTDREYSMINQKYTK
jgi:hypothetical protein